MSDSPNRAVDFGAGVLVGILLAVGIGGAYLFTKVREDRMRAREAEMAAREAEIVARLDVGRVLSSARLTDAETESLDKLSQELERVRTEGQPGIEKLLSAPEMPP